MRSALAVSILIFALSSLASGQQSAKATLTGTITDPNGAVVPGVNITATHTATGVRREAITNGEGLYVLADLPPGDYELTVQAQGFIKKTTKVPVPLKVVLWPI